MYQVFLSPANDPILHDNSLMYVCILEVVFVGGDDMQSELPSWILVSYSGKCYLFSEPHDFLCLKSRVELYCEHNYV